MSTGASTAKKRVKSKKLILFQPMMIKVVYGLLPCVIGSISLFGWRSLFVALVVLVVGTTTEGAFALPQGKPITSAVFVTCLIFALSLPPTTPLWMAIVGIIFGVAFGKMVFGGFGFNVYNPAMVGRCFVYITFPIALTGRWVNPFPSPWEGFTNWLPSVDAVSSATPLAVIRSGGKLPLERLFLGNVSGSFGETSALLILLGGIFIIVTKTASWRLTFSCILGGVLTATVMYLGGLPATPDPLSAILAGSFLFGAFFVVTEPISGPKTKPAQWIYGFLIGSLVMILRRYSNFSEGIMFSVLFMNTFVPILDIGVRTLKQKRAAGESA